MKVRKWNYQIITAKENHHLVWKAKWSGNHGNGGNDNWVFCFTQKNFFEEIYSKGKAPNYHQPAPLISKKRNLIKFPFSRLTLRNLTAVWEWRQPGPGLLFTGRQLRETTILMVMMMMLKMMMIIVMLVMRWKLATEVKFPKVWSLLKVVHSPKHPPATKSVEDND